MWGCVPIVLVTENLSGPCDHGPCALRKHLVPQMPGQLLSLCHRSCWLRVTTRPGTCLVTAVVRLSPDLTENRLVVEPGGPLWTALRDCSPCHLPCVGSREAARECRRKKKEYVKCLENRVAVLENQNKTLIEELKALKDLYCHKAE